MTISGMILDKGGIQCLTHRLSTEHMRLHNKVAIITGGASGIGKDSAELFAKEGAKVVIADLNEEKINNVVSSLSDEGYEAIGFSSDVSKDSQVRNLMDKTISHFGRIDILFNNAGTILPKDITDVSESEWDKIFRMNVKSMFLTIKYAIEHLKQTEGNIINMASMAGVAGQQSNPVYSSTKGAVIALTKALAIDCAPNNVRINAICPAGVNTPLLEKWFLQQTNPEKAKKEQDLSHMLGRTASTTEIANVALFLASNESSFVTGENIIVDGAAGLGYGKGEKAEWNNVKKF